MSKPTPTNYEQVAEIHFMPPKMKARYCAYMRARWASEETQQCGDGYASEWAQRFTAGREYAASDSIGKNVLDTLAQANQPARHTADNKERGAGE